MLPVCNYHRCLRNREISIIHVDNFNRTSGVNFPVYKLKERKEGFVTDLILSSFFLKAFDREGDPIRYLIQNGDPQQVFNLSQR